MPLMPVQLPLRWRSQKAEYPMIRITDNGRGMEKDQVPPGVFASCHQ